MRNEKIRGILIIIMFLIIVGLSTYIIYEKRLNEDIQKELQNIENDLDIYDNSLITFKYPKKLNVLWREQDEEEKYEEGIGLLALSSFPHFLGQAYDANITRILIKYSCYDFPDDFISIEKQMEIIKKERYEYYGSIGSTTEIQTINGYKVIVDTKPDLFEGGIIKSVSFYNEQNKKIFSFMFHSFFPDANFEELDKIVNTVRLK